MVKRKNGLMASSNKITVYLQAGKNPGKEQPHEAFVNLQDDEASIQAFARRWGPVSHAPLMDAAKLGFRNTLRSAWRGDAGALKEVQDWINRYMFTSLKFSDGRIEMAPEDLLGTIFLLFLRDHFAGKTAICANPNCAQPFFVKSKSKQKLCELRECAAYAQRQYALKWWNEVGKKEREKRQKKARSKGRK
jgi:hypothetical protein